jgi:hypothetical protein
MAVDLLAHQSRETTEDVAIVRIELLYPFPVEALKKVLAGYPNKQEVVWVQEEPHNMSAVLELRSRRKDSFKERHHVSLGFMSFFTKATVGALKAFPRLNAEIEGNEMVVKYYYDIGIAVGAEEGLVVPVLRDADRKSFAEIEREIAEPAKRARENRLTLAELQGGTFTITNGGVFGSLLSTPILNAPQVGILGMHKIEQRPVVVSGQIVIRPMMYVALSYDHRLVDGREAVQFLVRINVTVRAAFGLYANVRPCVSYFPFVETKHPLMDVIIIRENEEDLYAGIEYRQTDDMVQSLKLISRPGSEKIIHYAFEYARSHDRTKVTCFIKDNIMKLTDGLFHRVFNEIAAEYPDIANETWIVDIGSAKMADTPEAFDVIVLPNLYGDILSDVAAQLSGSVWPVQPTSVKRVPCSRLFMALLLVVQGRTWPIPPVCYLER